MCYRRLCNGTYETGGPNPMTRRMWRRPDPILTSFINLRGAEENEVENEPNDNGGAGGEGDNGGNENDSDDGAKNPRIKELSDENARRRNNEKRLEAELEAQRTKLKEFEDKDKSELERTSGERDELKTKLDQEVSTNRELRLTNAFLMTNTVTWHDPAMALRSLNTTDVVTKDGDIDEKALKTAIEKLAKEKPFLVKSDGGDGQHNGPTGAPVGSGARGVKQKDRAALEQKYPALRK